MTFVGMLRLMRHHVRVHISGARDLTAARLQTNPVFSLMRAFGALLVHLLAEGSKHFYRGNVLFRTVRAVLLGVDCKKSLDLH